MSSSSSERSPASRPQLPGHPDQSVAWRCFAGGPAPAANAVISTARPHFSVMASKSRHPSRLSHLMEFGDDHPMVEGRDYIVLNRARLQAIEEHAAASSSGRPAPNPGKDVSQPEPPDRCPSSTRHLRPSIGPCPPSGSTPWSRSAGTTRSRRPINSSGFRTISPRAPSGSRWSTSPRRSTTITAGSTSPSAISPPVRLPRQRDPKSPGRCRGGPDLLPRREHGPERRLAGLRDRHRGEASLVLSIEDLTEELHDRGNGRRSQDRGRP